ncbi:MAG TPA: urease accessory protein UreD [Burkholderiaceae bacterium]|nr:urease accessory protein UreD [Burkholderiaceae bacterium]
MDLATPPAAAARAGWEARLELRFEARGPDTRLAANRHRGPLRLIRALPLPDGRCQAVIVHPPGGLVGGDRLELDIALGPGARVLCTTPGAQKWYRSPGEAACATTRVEVAAGGALEWLPQPTIVYDAARVEQSIDFSLASDARLLGWECLVLGRAAMGERFASGALRQRLSLSTAGVPRWVEQVDARAGDRLFASPLGWDGRTVACTVWAAAPAADVDDALRDAWRDALDRACASAGGRAARLRAGATRAAPGLLAARLLADDSETAMRAAQSLWAIARPALIGAPGEPPRIWAT